MVDGAVKNNLPTDILHHMGADVIIAVDLGYSGQPNNELTSVGEILLQCIDIMGREVTLLKGEQYADIIIRPDAFNSCLTDSRQITLVIGKGAQATWSKMDEIKRLIRTEELQAPLTPQIVHRHNIR